MTKVCTKCGNELLLAEYYKRAGGRGLQADCKDCVKERARQWGKENKERLAEYKKQYRAKNKDKLSEIDKQYRAENKEKIKQRLEENKDSIADKRRQYREENKDSLAKLNKQWKIENKEKCCIIEQRRRARKKDLPATLTIDQWEKIKKEFDDKCAYCGKKEKLCHEHFVPLSKDGEYTHNNIIPACGSCNTSKQGKSFFEWYPKQDFYNQKREKKIFKHLNYKGKCQQLSII